MRESKRAKVIPTVKGVEASDYIKSPFKESESEDYNEKLKSQFKELLRSQEIVIQQQEKALLEQRQTINQQSRMIQDQQGRQSSNRAQEVACSSTSILRSVLPSSSIRTGGAGTIDNFLKPNALSFLHRVKPEVVEIKDDDVVIAEHIPGVSTSSQPEVPPEKVFYVPKQVPEVENLVLVPARVKKGTSLRSSVRGPVPEKLQDPQLFYCNKCEAKYTTRDECKRHMRVNCLKNTPEFFCDQCDEWYFWPNTMREHYYKEHVGIFLYHCRKCNQGFHWKSRIPAHKNACPNKDGPDVYEGRAPWDEKIEEKIKRKKAIPVNIPKEVLKIAEEEFAREQSQFESPLPTEAVPKSSAVVRSSQKIPVSSTAVDDLSSEQIPSQSAMDDVPQQQPQQALSGTVSEVISEDQLAVQNIKYDTYKPETSTAENVLEMMSEGRLPNITGDEEAEDDNAMIEVEFKLND